MKGSPIDGSRSIHDRSTAKNTSRTRRRSASVAHFGSSWESASSRAATSAPRRPASGSRPSSRPSRPIVGVDVLRLHVVVALLGLLDLVEYPAALWIADEGPVLLKGRLGQLVAVDHLAGLGVLHPVARAALEEGDEPVLPVVGDVDHPHDLDVVEREVLDAVDAVLALEALELELVAPVEGHGDVRARRGDVALRPRRLDGEERLADARPELHRIPVAVVGLRRLGRALRAPGPNAGLAPPLGRALEARPLPPAGHHPDQRHEQDHAADDRHRRDPAALAAAARAAAAAVVPAATATATAAEAATATAATRPGGAARERPGIGRDRGDEHQNQDCEST